MSIRKSFPLINIMNNALIDLPTPINLSVNWNFGSLLGIILVNQLVTGIVLSLRFSGHILTAFDSVVSICQDSQYGWLLRLMHSTGASFFFLFLYLHIGRGLYYGSYNKTILWNIGVTLYLLIMGTAFLGYVLPWGQMSYWAATVITNLLSAIPIFGSKLVIWVWGGFAVSNPTLTRFFGLHFLLPFVISGLVVLHIYYLHLYGSSNPLGMNFNHMKVSFHYYFSVKDSFYFILMLLVFIFFSCAYGYSFMDAENFIPANILVTPSHIQPEWYFLFAYAILRAIPNKLGGVIALVAAVMILFLFSIKTKNMIYTSLNMSLFSRLMFWILVNSFFLLTWLGSCVAEYPFIGVSQFCSILYFSMFLMILFKMHLINKMVLK